MYVEIDQKSWYCGPNAIVELPITLDSVCKHRAQIGSINGHLTFFVLAISLNE